MHHLTPWTRHATQGWALRAVALALALVVGSCTTVPHTAIARGMPASFSPLVKRVLPSVVNIAVTETITGNDVASKLPPELQDTPLGREFKRRFGNRRERMMGAGSGFVIDPNGIIVTNNHVVGHAEKIVVSLTDGRQLPARVLGTDALTDIAVIRVDAAGLPHVTWGDSKKVEVGDWILAAGNPFGLGGSVTAGIVSAEGRDLGSSPFDSFLQLDAPINPGNSGGPIFNMEGDVIGVSTAIVSPSGGSVGIGFAIPSDTVQKIVAQLLAHGTIERGWLGVAIEDTPAGVRIASVEPNGPAMHAGLRAGDLVVAINSARINSSRGLIRAIAATPPGGTAHVGVRRDGHVLDMPVTVGRRPPDSSG